MTDLEETPEDPTPLQYENLPDVRPAKAPASESAELAEGESLTKVLGLQYREDSTRKGGLSG